MRTAPFAAHPGVAARAGAPVAGASPARAAATLQVTAAALAPLAATAG